MVFGPIMLGSMLSTPVYVYFASMDKYTILYSFVRLGPCPSRHFHLIYAIESDTIPFPQLFTPCDCLFNDTVLTFY